MRNGQTEWVMDSQNKGRTDGMMDIRNEGWTDGMRDGQSDSNIPSTLWVGLLIAIKNVTSQWELREIIKIFSLTKGRFDY